MKKVLKIVSLLALAVGLTLFIVACGGNGDNGGTPAANGGGTQPATTPTPNNQAEGLSIFLISHSPPPASTLDDGSFNEGAATGIRRFLASNPGTYQFMQPHAATDEARLDIFADAIAAGADVLVLPGFHFASSVYQAQTLFPNTYFIVLDTGPTGAPASNLVGVLYAEQESGFLAGYASVMEGFRELGFIGGVAVPAVIRFGLGFLQGAEHAAASLGLPAGSVNINYMYAGGFGAAPEHTVTASAWYVGGTEVIFVAAGAVGFSVMHAAEEAPGRWVIGVDVDQSGDSDTVLTSATKALDNSVYALLGEIRDGTFRGGNVITFDAASDGVALPMATSRFQNFTEAQYTAIFNQLASGAIRVEGLVTYPLDPPAELQHVINQLNIVNVNEI